MKKSLRLAGFLMTAVAAVVATYVFDESQRELKVGVILAGAAIGLVLLWVSSRTS